MTKTYYFSTHGAAALAVLFDPIPDDVLGCDDPPPPPPALPFCKNACMFSLFYFCSVENIQVQLYES